MSPMSTQLSARSCMQIIDRTAASTPKSDTDWASDRMPPRVDGAFAKGSTPQAKDKEEVEEADDL